MPPPKKSPLAAARAATPPGPLGHAFQRRWNITWDDEFAFRMFRNRLLSLIDKHLGPSKVLNVARINQYAYYCGEPPPYSASADNTVELFFLEQYGLAKTIVYSTMLAATTVQGLVLHLEFLLAVLSEVQTSPPSSQARLSVTAFVTEFKDLLAASPGIPIRLSTANNTLTLYPAGAALLDESLVNDNLAWLRAFPLAHEALRQALQIYLGGDRGKFRNLIDNLRVALEQLLRAVLGTNNSLENQSKPLDAWFVQKGVHKQIRNLYGQFLFGQFTILQNDAAKHGVQEFDIPEIEFLIYQTGTFIRLIAELSDRKAPQTPSSPRPATPEHPPDA